jgi:tetratricopeptide (TPR) repeat protein
MLRTTTLKLIALIIAFCGVSTVALAKSQVVVIKHDGKECKTSESTCTANIRVAAGTQKLQNKSVSIGDEFASGTTIETPPRVSLALDANNGNVITIDANTKLRLSPSESGTSVTMLAGKAWFHVKNALNFFKVSDATGKFQGAVKGTRFSVEIKNGKIDFQRTEGTVVLEKTVKLAFKTPPKSEAKSDKKRERSQDLTTSKYEELGQDNSSVSYDLGDYDTEPQLHDTIEDAQQLFLTELAAAQQKGDMIAIADNHSVLGQLYLEQGDAETAVQHFSQAIMIFEKNNSGLVDDALAADYSDLGYAYLELGNEQKAYEAFEKAHQMEVQADPGDPDIAESLLDLADAAAEAGQESKAKDYLLQAIEILQYNYAIDQDDLETYQEMGTPENVEYLELLVANDQQMLAHAYDQLGDNKKADEYFTQSNSTYERYDVEGEEVCLEEECYVDAYYEDEQNYDEQNYDEQNYDEQNYDEQNYDEQNYDEQNYDEQNYDGQNDEPEYYEDETGNGH